MNIIQENSTKKFLKLIISISERKALEANMTSEEKEELVNKKVFEYLKKNEIKLEEILAIYKDVYTDFSEEGFILYVLNHSNEKKSIKEVFKLIISINERKALEDNMTLEEKDNLINETLFEYYKKSKKRLGSLLPIIKETYTKFSQKKFIEYILANTSSSEIIFDVKLVAEKKLKDISDKIFEIDRQLNTDGTATENLSSIDLKFNQLLEPNQSIALKINEVKNKYKLPVYKIKPKEVTLTDEQLQEYIDIISEMVKNYPNMEDLYKIAREQIIFFSGMGNLYENELRKKAPELFEYIDSLMKDEINSIMEEKQKLEAKRQKLKEMEVKYVDICKKYDEKLPEELRGTAEEREKRNGRKNNGNAS